VGKERRKALKNKRKNQEGAHGITLQERKKRNHYDSKPGSEKGSL